MVVTTEQEWLGNVEWFGKLQVHQPPQTWAAQAMRLPVWWYESIEKGSGAEFPVSGDATMKAKANPPMIFCTPADSPRSPSAPFARVNPGEG